MANTSSTSPVSSITIAFSTSRVRSAARGVRVTAPRRWAPDGTHRATNRRAVGACGHANRLPWPWTPSQVEAHQRGSRLTHESPGLIDSRHPQRTVRSLAPGRCPTSARFTPGASPVRGASGCAPRSGLRWSERKRRGSIPRHHDPQPLLARLGREVRYLRIIDARPGVGHRRAEEPREPSRHRSVSSPGTAFSRQPTGGKVAAYRLLARHGAPGTVVVVAAMTRFRCEALAERIEALRESFSQSDQPPVDDELRFRFESVPGGPDQREQLTGTL
jgi:hypothetical protein